MGWTRKNALSDYDTMAFLIAMLQLEEKFIQNNEEEEFWGVFYDSDFFPSVWSIDRYCMDNIFRNISSEHVKLIRKFIAIPERLTILRELYLSRKSHEWLQDPDEVLQRSMLLGLLMVEFLRIGIRPYMLEPNKASRAWILEEWRDWVYELSELFYDFSNDQFYHMGWFGQMYESIKHQALQLQDRKEQKLVNIRYASTVAIDDILLSSRDASTIKSQAWVALGEISRKAWDTIKLVADLLQRINQ